MRWGWNAPFLEGDFPAHSKLPTGTALNVPSWWAVSLKGECLSSECYLRVFPKTLEIRRGLHCWLFTSYALFAKKLFVCGNSYSHIPVRSGTVFHVSQHVLGDSTLLSSLGSGLSFHFFYFLNSRGANISVMIFHFMKFQTTLSQVVSFMP